MDTICVHQFFPVLLMTPHKKYKTNITDTSPGLQQARLYSLLVYLEWNATEKKTNTIQYGHTGDLLIVCESRPFALSFSLRNKNV